MATSASLCEGPIFYFMSFTFMQKSRWSSPFPFSFYPLASTSCWEDHDIYIQLDVRWHELLLLTSPKGEYVWRQHYKPLSFSVSNQNFITTSIAWVLAIVEDYMMVEYVKFAKSKLWHRPFLKIGWIAIVWWLRMKFASFQESLWSML